MITLSGRGRRHGQRSFRRGGTLTVCGGAIPLPKTNRCTTQPRGRADKGDIMNKTLGAVAATLLTTTSALAQDAPVFTLDEIIFSAGLTALEASRTGVSVEVVTEEELQESGDIQLSDYLSTLPGISVTQNGPIGTNATFRIRGLNGNYIPVLINGIDVTDPSSTQASFNFGLLNTGGLSRIEVLYGSQSAIYGSEAIAGVVNITTLAPPDEIGTEITLSAEAGSYNTYRGSFGIGSRFERGELAFTATRLVTDGFSAADENQGNTEADGHDATTLTFTGAYDLTDTVRLGASVFWQDSFVEFDNSGGAGGDGDRFGTTEQRAARVFAEIDGAGIDHEIALQYANTIRADPTAPAFFDTSDFEGTRTGLSYQGTLDLGADSAFVFGAEHVREEYLAFRPGGASFTGDYDISSVFGEYTTAITPDFDFSASLRFDEHSLYGNSTTGRIALAWRPGPDTILRASFGTGFRAPSLNELFGPFNSVPNPDLQPEESRSAEISVEHDFGSAQLGAAVFYTEIDNLIDYVFRPGPAPDGYEQIAGTSVSKGIELTSEIELSPTLTAFGNYTYTDAENADGTRRTRVPEHDVTLGLRGDWDNGWSGLLTVQHVAERLDGGPVPDYTLANFTVSREINDRAEVYLRVNNLFDEEYQTTRGYGTSDRAFYLGVRASF